MSAPVPGAAPSRRTPRPLVPRAADLPYFYVLLLLQVAVLAALPIGAWVLAPLVGRLTALERLPRPAPAGLLVLLALVEYGFLLRARRLWRRIRAVRHRR